jgi:hypothetical protein
VVKIVSLEASSARSKVPVLSTDNNTPFFWVFLVICISSKKEKLGLVACVWVTGAEELTGVEGVIVASEVGGVSGSADLGSIVL